MGAEFLLICLGRCLELLVFVGFGFDDGFESFATDLKKCKGMYNLGKDLRAHVFHCFKSL